MTWGQTSHGFGVFAWRKSDESDGFLKLYQICPLNTMPVLPQDEAKRKTSIITMIHDHNDHTSQYVPSIEQRSPEWLTKDWGSPEGCESLGQLTTCTVAWNILEFGIHPLPSTIWRTCFNIPLQIFFSRLQNSLQTLYFAFSFSDTIHYYPMAILHSANAKRMNIICWMCLLQLSSTAWRCSLVLRTRNRGGKTKALNLQCNTGYDARVRASCVPTAASSDWVTFNSFSTANVGGVAPGTEDKEHGHFPPPNDLFGAVGSTFQPLVTSFVPGTCLTPASAPQLLRATSTAPTALEVSFKAGPLGQVWCQHSKKIPEPFGKMI